MDAVATGAGPGLSARVVVQRSRFAVDVALEVALGETVAVMGPSGAGKSTLLGALAGLEELAAGEIVVGGRVVDRRPGRRVHVPPMERGIVLLAQDPRLFPHLTARENVAFAPRARGIPRASANDEADAWLERVGLPGAGDRRPGELSGGEQQRVAVARALAAGPRAVLLDEPLVALDPDTAGGIRAMLAEQLVGATVVAVTHDAVDAVALAERLIVIEDGRVTQSGSARDVLSSPASRFVASVAGVNRVVGAARNGGWEHDGLRLAAGDAASVRLASEEGARLAAVFRPGAVRVRSREATAGSGTRPEANEWVATVERLEQTLAGVRVHAGGCAADVESARAVGLRPGESVLLSIDRRDVRLIRA